MNSTKRKVNYAEYKGKYDESISKRLETDPLNIDIESMRNWLYGFTFTEEYAKKEIPDEMSMDYWSEKFDNIIFNHNLPQPEDEDPDDYVNYYEVNTPQEHLLLMTIDSTGDGKTPDTALTVIDVYQEYEYLRHVYPYARLEVKRQIYKDGIDCLEFKPNFYDIEKIYFDISRRFEVGY